MANAMSLRTVEVSAPRIFAAYPAASAAPSSAMRRIMGVMHRVTVWDEGQWAALAIGDRPASADHIGASWVEIRPI